MQFVITRCAVAAVSFMLFAPLASAADIGPQQANREGRTALPMHVGSNLHFREIGPAATGGRVTAVAGDAGNPSLYYVGAADGGIFRTENGGTTWTALFQHQRVASIGALALDPKNPSVIWAGTGEANVRNDISYGDGIYKSTDGGRHWTHMGLDHTFQISRIAVDPINPTNVLVAAMGSPWADNPERGVYRTADGGKTWQKTLYIGPEVGIADLAMDPKNPEIVFAATYRYRRTPWTYSEGGPEDAIYKSIDGGITWKRLTGHGLPEQPVSRIGLAVSASDPDVVYAVMGSNEGVLWRSDDQGEHWALVSKDEEVDARPFYFSHLAVDPKNPDHVFAISNDLMESTDGGKSFEKIAKKVHVDHHAMWIDPTGSGRIIEGNDGGVAISQDNGKHWAFHDNLAIGQYYHIALGAGMQYEVCGGLQDNSAWCGPSWSKDRAGILNRMWFALNGGDGVFAIPAADNPDLIYNSTQNGAYMLFDRKSEQSQDIEPFPRDFVGKGVADLRYRFAWEAALAVAPDNPKVLYAGGNAVFKSEDRGRTWQAISPDLTRNDKSKQGSSGGPVMKDNSGAEIYDAIITISVAPSDPNVIWVGTDDGKVQLTRDGGKHWTDVTRNIDGLEPWGRVESIDVSPDNPGQAVIAVDRHFSGDFKPYLFRTDDFGAGWRSMTGNLPRDSYAHVVRQDRHNNRLYYAGLENGLYVSWDAGAHWYLFGLGLPNTSVYDIALDDADNDLVAATHGRSLWVLDDLTPFQDFNPGVAKSPLTLFKPQKALRYWPWSYVENLGDGTFYGENPEYGASFSYYLPHTEDGTGTLVITNAAGAVVRTLKGLHQAKKEEMTPEEKAAPTREKTAAMQSGNDKATTQEQEKTSDDEGNKKKVPWISGEAGLHRVTWDLRTDGPVRWNSGLKFQKGPKSGALVPPGTYTATLTIGGHSVSQRVTVINDPSSPATLADMEKGFDATRSVLHELSQLDVALNRLHAIDGQSKALRAAAKDSGNAAAVDQALDTLDAATKAMKLKITSDAGAEEATLRTPDQIRQKLQMVLYLVSGSDAPPSAAELAAKAKYDSEYRQVIADYNSYLTNSVESLNRTMAGNHLPGVAGGDALTP